MCVRFLKFSSSKYEVFFSGNCLPSLAPVFSEDFWAIFSPNRKPKLQKNQKTSIWRISEVKYPQPNTGCYDYIVFIWAVRKTHTALLVYLLIYQRIFKGWLYRPSTSEELVAYFRNPMMKLTRIFVAPVISSCFSSHHYRLFRKQWEFLYLKRKRQRIWWFFDEMPMKWASPGSSVVRSCCETFSKVCLKSWSLIFSSILP